MKIHYRNFFIRLAYICIDFVSIIVALTLTCKIRHTTLPFDVTVYNIFFGETNPFRFIFIFWVVTTILFLNTRSLYYTRREVLESFELGMLFKAVLLASVVVIVALYGFKVHGFPRTILFIGSILILFLLSVWRILKRWFVEYLVRHGYNNFNALIIGAGKVGTALYNEIKKRPGLGINVVGFLDDFKDMTESKDMPRILGKSSDFVKIARREFINKVFITTYNTHTDFLKLLEIAKRLGIAVRVVPHGFELISGDFFKYNIGVIPILEYSQAQEFQKQAGKRVFDFIVALILLIISSPLFIVIAVVIKATSPGPVFYLSRRYGRGGRKFYMYKFRSMVKDADKVIEQYLDKNEADGPIFKIKNDPRVTKIGRVLRKYSLDELPQLFNVIKGDMSLVGPRPLPIDQIHKEDLRQLKRLEVRPGITGLWQIRGRSDISFSRLVRWDIWYINNWSFWLDINILFQTIPAVIKGRGAY